MRFIIEYLIENNYINLNMYQTYLTIQFFALFLLFAFIIFLDYYKLRNYRIANRAYIDYVNQAISSIIHDEHSIRVATLCVQLGKAAGLRRKSIKKLYLMGLLHDIGKINIPSHILNKPDKLNEDEMRVIREHVNYGYKILSVNSQYSAIAKYIEQHHERIDGQGYPRGIRGEKIEIFSKILSIADAYSAMTSDRPYRKAMLKEEAVSELITNSNKQFDSKLVKQFISLDVA